MLRFASLVGECWIFSSEEETESVDFIRFGTLSTGVCDFISAVCTVSDTNILLNARGNFYLVALLVWFLFSPNFH